MSSERRIWRTSIWYRPIGSTGPWQWCGDTGGDAANVSDCLIMCAKDPTHEYAMTPFVAEQRVFIAVTGAPDEQ